MSLPGGLTALPAASAPTTMAGADTAETSSVTPPAADAASASTTPPTEASEENVPPDQQPGGHAADDATQQQPGAPQQLASEGQEGTTAAAVTSTAIVAAAKPGVHPVPIPMGGMDGAAVAAAAPAWIVLRAAEGRRDHRHEQQLREHHPPGRHLGAGGGSRLDAGCGARALPKYRSWTFRSFSHNLLDLVGPSCRDFEVAT